MSYELDFRNSAYREWKKLAPSINAQFKKKLDERLLNPHVPADKLSGYRNVYKIKLRSAGYRLVYEVQDDKLVIIVIAVGKREGGAVYDKAKDRM